MTRDAVNPHGFDEYKLQHEATQKSIDRLLASQTDTRQRVDTLVRAVFALSGGALTISIGIFLKSGAPNLSANLARSLQHSWWLLFYGLAASATLLFVMICQGYWQASQWERALGGGGSAAAGGGGRGILLVRVLNWVLGATGFVAFLVGLALLAHVSVGAVSASPNPSIERTASSGFRPLPAAAHVQRWAPANER